MSSGSATSTQTTGSPVLEGILNGFGGAVNQAINMPYQQYNGPRVANLSNLQQNALGNYQGVINDPMWSQAASTYGDLQLGSMSPYLQQVRDTTISDATDAFNRATAGTRAQFNTPGNFGSARQNMAQDRNETTLARGLAQGLGGINAQAYENMQNRRLQAAGGAQQLGGAYSNILNNSIQAGNTQRNFDQSVIDALYGDWQRANDYPWSQIERGAGVFGQLQGGAPRTTTTTGPGADPVAQGLGAWALGSSLGNSKGGSGTRAT